MSHKIAKAQCKAERNAATPNDMHLLIIESNRQRRRANAHTLKDTNRPHSRSASTKREGKVRQAKRLLRGEKEDSVLMNEWGRSLVITES